VRAEEKLTAFVRTRIRDPSRYDLLAASEFDNFLFEIGFSFAFRDE
jgi:hypothetical protein